MLLKPKNYGLIGNLNVSMHGKNSVGAKTTRSRQPPEIDPLQLHLTAPVDMGCGLLKHRMVKQDGDFWTIVSNGLKNVICKILDNKKGSQWLPLVLCDLPIFGKNICL